MTYVENAESSETLKEALNRAGDIEEIELLNEDALAMTKREICNLLNNKIDHSISAGTLNSLYKFSKKRVIEGKRVFPWGKMEEAELNEADDNMGGGTW